MKPILSLDFDGVLHSYSSGWKGPRVIPDPPVPGAIDFLYDASLCFQVAIFSSRTGFWFGRMAMKNWISKWAYQQFHSANYGLHGGRNTPLEQFVTRIQQETWEPWDTCCHAAADKLVKRLEFPRHKPAALVSIDDRALHFTGIFPEISYLQEFVPWNKKKT